MKWFGLLAALLLVPAAAAAEAGQKSYRIVEYKIVKGVKQAGKDTVCRAQKQGFRCLDAKTQQLAVFPQALWRHVSRSIFASNTPKISPAHSYTTRNGASTFSCYHIMKQENCRWEEVTVGIGSVEVKWVCDMVESAEHTCTCISGCN